MPISSHSQERLLQFVYAWIMSLGGNSCQCRSLRVCELASCLLLVSRKSFWSSWVCRSFCQGNSGVWSLQHLPPSLDHVSLSMNNMKGHAWELSGYWNVLFMYLKRVVPARGLPHPIHLGYPRMLFETFFKDTSFLDCEKFFGLHYHWIWWQLTA